MKKDPNFVGPISDEPLQFDSPDPLTYLLPI